MNKSIPKHSAPVAPVSAFREVMKESTPLTSVSALRTALADILAKHSKIPPTEKKAG